MVDVWIKAGQEITASNNDETNDSWKNGVSADFTAPIKQELLETEKSSNDDHSALEFAACQQNCKVKKEVKEEITSHVYFEHDYVHFPNGITTESSENENNVTISHSPPGKQENVSLNSILINGNSEANNCTKIVELTVASEEIVETCTTETPTRILNGNSQPGSRDLGSSNISMSQDVKTMASNLENSSSKLQPLNISIPTTFEALRKTTNSQKKQILVMRDNKFVPVNSMNATNNQNSQIATIVSTIVTDRSKLQKNSILRPNVSLLKKPAIGNKKTMLLNLNPTNSLLLDSSNNIPALKIVEPNATNNRKSESIEKVIPRRPNDDVLSKIKNNGKEHDQHSLDNLKLVPKSKITIGKDRIGTSSKKEHYEEILR